MSVLLVITTGTTDVQIVKDGKRFELSKKKCGELLDQLVTRTYAFCDTLPEKAVESIESLPEGDLLVCTPKLDAVLRYFDEQLPQAVLILETGRSVASDPHQAGAVLERRLLERGAQQVCRQIFLRDQERLEDSENESDAVVRSEVVRRLADAIQNAFATRNPTNVYTALAGGIPEANEVIDELVRLYATASGQDCSVTSLKVPDGAKVKQEDRAVPEPFHPAAAIRARWHVLDLIQKGNLLAAWGAVSHLENQPGQEWTKVVRWLADFAASLPIADDCDIDVLKHHRMAVRAALRVELALRAGDIPRAVHGTVAFFESALWDRLGEHFEPSLDKCRHYKLKANSPEPNEDLIRKSKDSKDKDSENDRKMPFEKIPVNGEILYKIHDEGACAGRLAKRYLNSDPLHKLSSAVDEIRPLRNNVAHNEPTPTLMEKAKEEMAKQKLWSEDNPPSLLSQPLVQNVLREFGKENPETLCTKLIEEVRSRLLNIAG